MATFAPVPPAAVRPGDFAHHVDGYDPRPVHDVDSGSNTITLDIRGLITEPVPMENYTFDRRVQP